MATDLFSPLEGFFLLRNLSISDPANLSFERVSDILKQNSILQKSESFDAGRLEPQQLKAQYIRLIEEEVEAQTKADQDGQTSRPPSKRKQASPRMETLEDTAGHVHLVPQVIERLYVRYRKAISQVIAQDEQTYHALRKQLDRPEHKERNGMESTTKTPAKSTSQIVPSIETLLRHEENQEQQGKAERQASLNVSTNIQHRPENHASYDEAARRLRTSNSVEGLTVQGGDLASQRGAFKPGSHNGAAETGNPYLPTPHHPIPAYPLPSNDIHPRHPPQADSVLSPSPRVGQSPPERSSTSPIILPPVPGMLRPQNSGLAGPVTENNGHLYRPASNMSPQPSQQPSSRPPSNRPQQSRAPAQYYPYHENAGYPAYNPYNKSFYGPSYQSSGPPYQPQYPPSYSNYPATTPAHTHFPNYSPNWHPQAVPAAYQASRQQAYLGHPQTSIETPNRPRPPSLAPLSTPRSSTKWKDVNPKAVEAARSATTPTSRSISPVTPRSESLTREETKPTRRETRNRANEDNAVKPRISPVGRGDQPTRRGRKSQVFAAADTSHGRSRSHSTTPQTDDQRGRKKASTSRRIKAENSLAPAQEDDVSVSSPRAEESIRKSDRRHRDVAREKERPTTPRTSVKRKRGDSVTAPLPSPSLRSTPAISEPSKATLPRRPGYVFALKNLGRASSALLNTITGHKYASLFAKPLTEREAPGYSALIHRTQDLKTIKAAMIAGSKIVTALVEQSDDEAASGAPYLWVPETEDVIPPKGIVNSAQLEMELTRIFANAVMFNPDLAENRGMGPAFRTRARTLKDHEAGDGDAAEDPEADEEIEGVKFEIGVARPDAGAVVKDARDMYAAVEEALEGWRTSARISTKDALDAPIIESSVGKDNEKSAEEGENNQAEEENERPRPKRRRR